jgi:hypothetical protein
MANVIRIRFIQYDKQPSYELEIYIDGHHISVDLNAEQYERLKSVVDKPEQLQSYGN